MQDCSKLVKAWKLLREYEVKKKQRKKKPFPPKLPKPPVKPKKSNKKTSKVYRAKEAKSELELETLTNTLDTKDKEFETCCLSKDILSKASLST
jgi:hypothetical protein